MDRITLGNEEFEGNNNAYVLAGDSADSDGNSLALVDTAIATPDCRADLREGLAERGYEFSDVDDIVLTHFHPDHSGLAGEIQAESDATVYVHEADAPLVAGDADALDNFDQQRRDCLEQWGLPEDARQELLDVFEAASKIQGEPADVTPIEDGDVLEVGGRQLTTVHAPGHAAGLCWFESENGPDSTSTEAFVGDTILPVYTPNIGGADVRVERPLEQYLETLERLVERDYDRVWPGHRDPIEEPTKRARTIAAHHRERTENVLEVLADHGPADPWTVSAQLFGDLEGIHILHGPGEAYAHLDHLSQEGVLNLEDGEYQLTVDVENIDLDAVLPSITSSTSTA
ncbi:MBL fold metallo-hydrolase [Natronolimnobius sp. AArcel1]|uniref:MBL fold metallo-hydrolase n=1 Tax=Natronolimnobius sp. AArcel1 TaxID=1679093 RepID=UPI0013ECD926|nr:MBL fold metallo-hydrolase [Natronolimnobius sp. AArcel1]NGM70798.1 MBL fold metallo-hydrolase [Natronolimnobius sp. AArcel1]